MDDNDYVNIERAHLHGDPVRLDAEGKPVYTRETNFEKARMMVSKNLSPEEVRKLMEYRIAGRQPKPHAEPEASVSPPDLKNTVARVETPVYQREKSLRREPGFERYGRQPMRSRCYTACFEAIKGENRKNGHVRKTPLERGFPTQCRLGDRHKTCRSRETLCKVQGYSLASARPRSRYLSFYS